MKAWKKDLCKHYSISHIKSNKIIEVAKCLKKRLNFYRLDQVKDMFPALGIKNTNL